MTVKVADTQANVGVTQVSLELRVIRADGSVVELGEVACWHRNPLKRAAWRIQRWVQRVRRMFH